MSSLSESSEHGKIHKEKALLCQDARKEFNSGMQITTERVSNLIGVSLNKKKEIDTEGLWARILSNDLKRAERRKVREMAGVNKLLRWQALNLPGPDSRHPALSKPVKKSDLGASSGGARLSK